MGSDQPRVYYDRPDVVATYEAARECGFRERERRAIDRHFDTAGRVLDLGCGAGRTSTALAAAGYETVALDSSRPMIRAATDAEDTANDVAYLVGDAVRLPFVAGSFANVLFSYNGLAQLQPESARVEALREVYRVLEPGGHFAFSTHNLLRWLLPLPLTRNWLGKLARFWLRNAREGALRSPYKHLDDGHPVHFTDPLSLVRLVRAVGFDIVELLGTSRPGSTLLGNSLFVVARVE